MKQSRNTTLRSLLKKLKRKLIRRSVLVMLLDILRIVAWIARFFDWNA